MCGCRGERTAAISKTAVAHRPEAGYLRQFDTAAAVLADAKGAGVSERIPGEGDLCRHAGPCRRL